jgi:serine/threonine protein kinase
MMNRTRGNTQVLELREAAKGRKIYSLEEHIEEEAATRAATLAANDRSAPSLFTFNMKDCASHRLGVGTYGEVWLAKDGVDLVGGVGRIPGPVVLKVPVIHLEKGSRGFRQSAVTSANEVEMHSIVHGGLLAKPEEERRVLPLLGVAIPKEWSMPVLCFSYVDGGNALDWMRKGKPEGLRGEGASRLLLDMVEGLEYLHGNEIQHNDVGNPKNGLVRMPAGTSVHSCHGLLPLGSRGILHDLGISEVFSNTLYGKFEGARWEVNEDQLQLGRYVQLPPTSPPSILVYAPSCMLPHMCPPINAPNLPPHQCYVTCKESTY